MITLDEDIPQRDLERVIPPLDVRLLAAADRTAAASPPAIAPAP